MPAGDKGRPFKKIMKFIDWFAGIGGFRCGMELEGHECVGFCEYDKFAVASYISMHLLTDGQREYLQTLSLRQRQKEILKEEYKNGEWYANDVRRVDARSIPTADCWCFGFPCQDISVAGKQAGFKGNRSSLFFAVTRLLGAIEEESRPEYLFIENVKNLLSVNRGYDFARLLVELDEIGYDAEWSVLNSKNFGVPQNRERVFIIGHLRGRSEREVFPVRGSSESAQIEKIGTTKGDKNTRIGCRDKVYSTDGIMACLEATDYKQPKQIAVYTVGNVNPSGAGMNGNIYNTCGLCPTLTTNKGEGIKALQAGNIVEGQNWKNPQVGRVCSIKGCSPTLNCCGGGGHEPKIAIPVLTPNRIEKRQNGRRFKENGEPMFTLTSQDRHGVAIIDPQGRNGKVCKGRNVCPTLRAQSHGNVPHVVYSEYSNYKAVLRIRKLTPKECFRLQGWTDDYFFKAQEVNSDSQLYKQVGNGVTVTVIQAIAKAFSQLN